MPPLAPRTKVAVLGGGVGGMTAAFELTATPELRERFEVTVYQLGWRNGGKGASGRNAAVADRIEEHGLHVWFGFYDNAFRVMRDAYAELGRPPGTPLATFEDAFHACNDLVLYDRQGDGWRPLRLDWPANPLKPGDPGELPTFWEIAATACRWALIGWRGLRDQRSDLAPSAEHHDLIPDWFENLAADVAGDLLELPLDVAERLLGLAERLAGLRAGHTNHTVAAEATQPLLLVRLLEAFREWLWTAVVARRYKDDPDLRFFFTVVDAGVSTIAGIVKDGVLEQGFDVLNKEDWAAWLRRHGAREVTIGRTPAERSPLLRAVYDVAFAYPGGDIGAANCAAGTATNDLLRLAFSYRGSVMYKMQAGMGDVVFAPLHEVLDRRGVRFEFFHAITALHPGGNGIDSIEVVRQAELAPGVEKYDPLKGVKGLPCWPSEPRWEQLEAAAKGVDFEADPNPLGRPAHTLERGRDFDEVVLGIPVGALPEICGELMALDDRFRRGVESAVTVRTQAFQLWANRESAELGWGFDENSVAGCYVEPLDTYCDMTHLLPRESWTEADGTRTIGYVCGVLDDRKGETHEQATERAKQNAIEFVERDLGALWPGAAPGGKFDWSVLVDRDGRSGPARFDSQYWRANTSPWERYVLTPAGSVEHRLSPHESGFANLKLAGDWTANGIDGGCVEAAVISGMDAARAITGEPTLIPGHSTAWLQPQPRELPAYVEFGGRATAPSPFSCQGGRLQGLLLNGEDWRISDLVSRMFNVPSGSAAQYRSLGSRVMMLIGDFQRVTSLTQPFDRWGAVRETQVSFWIPVLAGRDLGGLFIAERLLLAVPYVLVDNPMSYLGGRETFGYAKTMGQFDPALGTGDHVNVKAFGGDFGRNEGADWRDFLEVIGGAPRPTAAPPERSSGPLPLVRHLVGDMPELAEGAEVVLGDIQLTAGLIGDLLAGRVGQVFLKQFRDANDGTRACYQAVVEAPIQIRRVESGLSARDWSIKVHPLDSHPIGDELGVGDQSAAMAFDIEIDFVVENGHEVGGRTVRLDPAPGGRPPGGPDGPGSAIEAAARWLWREITELERASVDWLRRI
jgi:uncharacterized protein with NAD-binding domain and iron-sulfur cluster